MLKKNETTSRFSIYNIYRLLPSPHHLGEVGGSCPLVGQGCLHAGVRGAADSVLELPWRLRGKESACKAGDAGDTGLIPESGRSPGGQHGNPLQYSCLENPMDRGGWWATVHGVAKGRTQLKRLGTCSHAGSHGTEWEQMSQKAVCGERGLLDGWRVSYLFLLVQDSV